VEESNIVSEIQFGESASGAAVVQGSFVGADSGAAKSMGPAFQRAGGGGEDREKTLREGMWQSILFCDNDCLRENREENHARLCRRA